jgi:hypothetical protein
MELVSVFGVVVPASMHGDRQSWIAIIESGAASAVKSSKARKAWAKEWSLTIRASWNPYGIGRALKIKRPKPLLSFFSKGDRVKIGPAGLDFASKQRRHS